MVPTGYNLQRNICCATFFRYISALWDEMRFERLLNMDKTFHGTATSENKGHYSQLSIDKGQRWVSMGNFLRSIGQAALIVILKLRTQNKNMKAS